MKNITVIFVLIMIWGCYGRRPPFTTGMEGKPIPSFDILLADSTTYLNTTNIPTGKPIVILGFSPNCPHCRAQMDDILENMGSLKDIRFYALTTWSFTEMKSFYNYFKLSNYSNVTVGVDEKYAFVNYYKFKGVPFIAIYGKDKKLNGAFLGNVTIAQIKDLAEK